MLKCLKGQLAEYHAAKEWRNKSYEKFAPPKPQTVKIDSSQHYVAKQEKRASFTKNRLSIIVIGNVDAGKSTTSGHLIAKVGFVDKNIISQYERQAGEVGKAVLLGNSYLYTSYD